MSISYSEYATIPNRLIEDLEDIYAARQFIESAEGKRQQRLAAEIERRLGETNVG